MAPLTNDYQSFENMNTSFVSSSLKTNQNNNNNNNNNYIDDNIDDNELKVLEASKSVTSMRTIVKNYSNSPITILNPRASNHSLKDATLLSKKQNKKSNKNNNNNNNNYDDSDPSLITYNSSKHTSKKRTSAAADSHITPPFTPTSQLTGMMSANQLHHYHNNRQSQQTNNTATTMTNNLNSTSIQHSIKLQQSSIHQTNTPIAGGGEAGSSYNRSTPSYQTTASTFDPTLITPYGGYNNTYTSQKTHSSIPFSTENSMMVQPNYFTNTNVNGSGGGSVAAAAAGATGAALNQNNNNSFMQFNNKDPNNPKDFSYMLFNIKVFRTPKEQS
jgi:hypothetical protein